MCEADQARDLPLRYKTLPPEGIEHRVDPRPGEVVADGLVDLRRGEARMCRPGSPHERASGVLDARVGRPAGIPERPAIPAGDEGLHLPAKVHRRFTEGPQTVLV